MAPSAPGSALRQTVPGNVYLFNLLFIYLSHYVTDLSLRECWGQDVLWAQEDTPLLLAAQESSSWELAVTAEQERGDPLGCGDLLALPYMAASPGHCQL